MSWTNVNKPTSSNWTNTNPIGKKSYNDGDTTFDDASIFYDGTNPNAWTSVAKPATSSWVSIAKPI